MLSMTHFKLILCICISVFLGSCFCVVICCHSNCFQIFILILMLYLLFCQYTSSCFECTLNALSFCLNICFCIVSFTACHFKWNIYKWTTEDTMCRNSWKSWKKMVKHGKLLWKSQKSWQGYNIKSSFKGHSTVHKA